MRSGVASRKPPFLAGVPSMFRALLADSAVPAPKLRMILTGGEVLAPGLAHAMRRVVPAAIHDLYGLTETGSCDFYLGPTDQPHGFGTIGHPTDRVMFRLARDRCAVATGETGELQIRTPFDMLGYFQTFSTSVTSYPVDRAARRTVGLSCNLRRRRLNVHRQLNRLIRTTSAIGTKRTFLD
jgi:acyl-coenzyme A synthetase/AMP-(fatty) acid ligase